MSTEEPFRKCTDCDLESKDLTKFVKSPVSKYGRRNLCIKCSTQRYREASKRCNRDWKTEHQVRKRYGVSPQEYATSMASSSKCEICEKTSDLCYDHCHDTMKFRGVLCRGCNRSLGQLGDTEEAIERVLKYLRKNNE